MPENAAQFALTVAAWVSVAVAIAVPFVTVLAVTWRLARLRSLVSAELGKVRIESTRLVCDSEAVKNAVSAVTDERVASIQVQINALESEWQEFRRQGEKIQKRLAGEASQRKRKEQSADELAAANGTPIDFQPAVPVRPSASDIERRFVFGR